MEESNVAKYEGELKKPPAEVKREIQKIEVQDQITSLIPLAGTIELTKEKMDILYAPVREEDVEIRPDGLIYLPWMEYATRLRLAFGPPVMIPYGPPKKLGNFIHWGFWLIIKGAPYGFAVGEQQYFENDRMTYGDALEGAKSNALMRICKGLGISLELWKPSFVKEWKSKFAETYEEKGKIKWRKKGAPKTEENGTSKDDIPEFNPPPDSETISDAQRKRFFTIYKKFGKTDSETKAFLYAEYGIEHTTDIKKSDYAKICSWAESRVPGQEG